MAKEIFNRHENKYRLDKLTFRRLMNEISMNMDADSHSQSGTYRILNIYYDTPNNDFIRTSLAKPTYKEKLRLRSYEVPNADSEVYVEIKKKVNGVVNKRRSCLELAEAYDFLESGRLPQMRQYMNRQVLQEVAYILEREKVEPALFLSYERLAFFGERDDLRVSFDTNILTRRSDLRLESGAYGRRLLDDGEWLMEIKTAGSIPLWLTGLLAEHKIYQSSFSKYGAEYQKTLESLSVSKETHTAFVKVPEFVPQPVNVSAMAVTA